MENKRNVFVVIAYFFYLRKLQIHFWHHTNPRELPESISVELQSQTKSVFVGLLYVFMVRSSFTCEILNYLLSYTIRRWQTIKNYKIWQCGITYYKIPVIVKVIMLDFGWYPQIDANSTTYVIMLESFFMALDCTKLVRCSCTDTKIYSSQLPK